MERYAEAAMMKWILGAAFMLAATSASAGVPTPVPEPGVLELLALGGVIAAVAAIRNRRK
jgi:hypothetical protein